MLQRLLGIWRKCIFLFRQRFYPFPILHLNGSKGRNRTQYTLLRVYILYHIKYGKKDSNLHILPGLLIQSQRCCHYTIPVQSHKMKKTILSNKDALLSACNSSHSQREVLETLGLRAAGGNFKSLQKWAGIHNITLPVFPRVGRPPSTVTPIDSVLTTNSNYKRTHLKKRLYQLGLKQRKCEICGQGEIWKGRKMSLILDHINGIANDNRLENLRIVCPNCNATLDTHCGKNNPQSLPFCPCGSRIARGRKFCNRKCFSAYGATGPKPLCRKVERPDKQFLMQEVASTSYVAVGRKYGVSDNTIRKWLK